MLKRSVLLLVLAASASAFAGQHATYPVQIADFGTYKVAGGGLGTARNSADPTQYIGCRRYTSLTSTTDYIVCYAMTAAGEWHSCVSSDPKALSIVSSLTSSSTIYFRTEAANPTRCSLLQVDTSSQYER